MTTTIRAVFDGEVLRPERPVDLEPNAIYVLTIEAVAASEAAAADAAYPLAAISMLATDMGVTDLSSRHGWYAHGGATPEPGA